MQADSGMHGDGFHNVTHEGSSEMAADHAVFETFRLAGAHTVRTSGNIDYSLGERLIQRHGSVGETTDAALVSQCLLQRFAEHDGDVFDGVVRVDVGVTGGFDGQVPVMNAAVIKMLKDLGVEDENILLDDFGG